MSKSFRPCMLAVAVVIGTQLPASAQTAWKSGTFGPPNGGHLVYRIHHPGNNPACASYNGRDCLWGQTIQQIDLRRVKPLVCGAPHKRVWGVTGYENQRHWCTLAKARSAVFD